jgi:hypothetical protein
MVNYVSRIDWRLLLSESTKSFSAEIPMLKDQWLGYKVNVVVCIFYQEN